MTYVLAIDQGTTSSRAIVFDASLNPIASAQEEFTQHFPQSGWVEHEPSDLWASTAATARGAVMEKGRTSRLRILPQSGPQTSGKPQLFGINQRASHCIAQLYGKTGEPLSFARFCARMDMRSLSAGKQGFCLTPYFSGTKLKWLLDSYDGAREDARGELLFGTVDSYLIWTTSGKVHATDADAARTMLYDIHKGAWSSEICDLFDIPRAMLPEVRDSGHPLA